MPPRILSPQPKSLSLKHVRSLGSLRFSLNPPRRSFSASSFADVATKPSSRYQIYISQSDNPFLNLSIEHYLLQKTPIDSTVLFLYVNRPCVVIGRNQNPWLEANLQLLKRGVVGLQASEIKLGYQYPIDVDLIRRRSGGGTVFHDYGNVNYSVICPPPDFTRDKHAEMVVRAIRQIDPRARVNDRHDIVLDQGEFSQGNNRKDHDHLHGTVYVPTSSVSPALKVSGSAYKLTRNRSLHHGTCLIQSPNLEVIPQYLRSPAKAFMKARGVDSVRSPISNIYDAHRNQGDSLISSFQRNVLKAFIALYSLDHGLLDSLFQDSSGSNFNCDKDWVCGYIRESVKDLLEIEEGLKELEVRDLNYNYASNLTIYLVTRVDLWTDTSICPI